MSNVFFDTKHVRRSGTVRMDKNHNPVFPLKPMIFLEKCNPVSLSNSIVFFQKPDNSIQNIIINYISLHQTNLM